MFQKLFRLFSVVIVLQFFAAFGVSANPALSGSWFNPDRNYEGFEFQVLENGDFLIIFYTYPGPTDDDNATQAFILGIGTLEGDTATINNAYRTRGPVFGEDYDKDDLVEYVWGTFTVEFSDDDNATVTYDGLDGAGSTQVTRLTSLAQGDNGGGLPAGISAIWFDPQTNGQGWFVEVLSPSLANVYWFTYDDKGNQAWNIGLGEIIGNGILVRNSLAGRGARFGTVFDSNDVTLEDFAAYSLDFSDCNTASVSYFAIDGSVSGALPLQRLTRLEGYPCDDGLFAAEDGELTMMSNSTDPLLSRYVGPDGTRFDQFVQRGENGEVISETGGEITLPDSTKLDLSVSPDGESVTVRPFDPGVWLTLRRKSGKLEIAATDKRSEASAQSSVDLPDDGDTGQSASKVPSADHVVSAAKPPRLNGAGDPTQAFVRVNHCTEPTADALVWFYVGEEDQVDDSQRPWLSDTLSIPGVADQDFPGEYSANLLESSAEEISQAAIEASCSENVLSDVCGVLAPLPPGYPSALDLVCTRLANAVAVSSGPLAGLAALTTCKASDLAVDVVCDSMFVRDRLCEQAPSVFRDTAGLTLDLWASGTLVHDGADATVGPVDFPDIGGFAELPDIELPDRPVLARLETEPPTPVAGDDYALTLLTSCTEPGQVFDVQQFFGLGPYGPERECMVTEENGACTVIHSTESDWIRDGQTTGVSDFTVTSPANKVTRHSVDIQLLQTPELISPLSEDILLPNFCDGEDSVTWPFAWNEVAGAASYNLGINHPNFEEIIEEGLVVEPDSQDTTALLYEFVLEGDQPFTGDDLTGWEWGVQAVSDSGTPSEWSYAGSFSVEACGGEPAFDLTGSWTFVDIVNQNDCGDPNAGTVGVVDLVQSGNTVDICVDNFCIRGSLTGNMVEWTGSFPEDGGITTTNIMGTVSANGNRIDGSTVWTFTDGGFSCGGTSTFEANRN